ncbi:molybdopterin-dependent oxidoreductase [Bacillus sp. 165]|uniref:molybdopterin-dependent oxidoreductase n=1 Tax=Bacillus sp. 165 TaxID=1529117 RepID=UPI0032AF4EEB
MGVEKTAKYVKFYSSDSIYTDTLTIDQAMMEDITIAVLRDGKPIEQDLGGPVRLIVPKMYAYKSVKWLNRIECIAQDHTGYWEARGYSTNAWVKAK